jgi:hypothetical protein
MDLTGQQWPIGLRQESFNVRSKTEVTALRRDVCFAPDERTSSGYLGMSEKCHNQKCATVVGSSQLVRALKLRRPNEKPPEQCEA